MQFLQSTPGDDPIVVEGYFAASPDEVYRAWTDPEMVVKWFGLEANELQSADIDLKPGGKWRFVRTSDGKRTIGFEGEYFDVQPRERLVYSWSFVVEHPNGEREVSPDSRVEVEFKPKGKGTIVRLVHSAVRSEDSRKGIGGGWEASFAHIAEMLGA